MKRTHSPLTSLTETDWQPSAELQLPVSSNAVEIINHWLQESLGPFHLNTTFLARIVSSAQDALSRVSEDGGSVPKRVHVRIFTPRAGLLHPAEAASWGFFRIERKDHTDAVQETPGHYIDFYLYIEN